MLSMFRMLIHPSSGACDLFVELFHGSYCFGSMCVGVTLWCGWGGLVSGCIITGSLLANLYKVKEQVVNLKNRVVVELILVEVNQKFFVCYKICIMYYIPSIHNYISVQLYYIHNQVTLWPHYVTAISCIQNVPRLVPILSHMNQIHTVTDLVCGTLSITKWTIQRHIKNILYFLSVFFSLCLDNVHRNTPCTLEFREPMWGWGWLSIILDWFRRIEVRPHICQIGFSHTLTIVQNSVSSVKLCASLSEVNSIRNQESSWTHFILPKCLFFLLRTKANSCYGSKVYYVSVVFYEFLQKRTCFTLEVNLGISFIGREYRNQLLHVTEFW